MNEDIVGINDLILSVTSQLNIRDFTICCNSQTEELVKELGLPYNLIDSELLELDDMIFIVPLSDKPIKFINELR